MAKSLFESIDETYAALPQASNTAVSNLRMALQDNLGDWKATRDAMQQADIELAKNVPTAIIGDTSGFLGSAFNTQIALGAGVADAVGTVARSVPFLMKNDMDVPPEVRAAYERVKAAEKNGIAPNEADVALINQISNPPVSFNTQKMMLGKNGAFVPQDMLALGDEPAANIPRTYADVLDSAATGKAMSDSIKEAADFSKYVNQTPVENIQEELGAAWDKKAPTIEVNIDKFMAGDKAALGNIVLDAASLGSDIVTTGVTNPGGSLQAIASTLPTSLTAAHPLTAALYTAGYSDRVYEEAKDNLEKHEGRPATPEERTNAHTKAMESALVETVSNLGELGVVKGFGGLKKAATGVAANIEKKVAANAAKNTVEEVAENAATTAARSATATTASATTEAVGKTATDVLKDIAEKALKSAPVVMKTGAIEGGEEAIQEKLEKEAEGLEATGKELFVAGGLGTIAGAGMGPAFNAAGKVAAVPSKVKEFARESFNTKQELAKARAPVVPVTPTTASSDEVDPIEKTRNDELDNLLSEVQGDPSKVKGAINQSAAKRRWVETADLTSAENLTTAEQYLNDLDTTQSKVLENALVNQNEGNQEQADKFMQAAESIATEMGKIQAAVNKAKGVTSNPSEAIATAKTPAEQQRVFGSHDLDTIQDEDLKAMTSWEGLTTNQKQVVESELAVRELRNTTDEVSGMFSTGGRSKSTGNFMTGITQYVDAIGSAVKSKNIEVAKQTIGKFNNWVETQTTKNDLVQEGWNLYTKNKKTPEESVRLAEIQNTLRTKYNMGNAQYQPIHNGAKKLVNNIANDTQALLNTKLKFDTAFNKITAVAPKQAMAADLDIDTMQDIPMSVSTAATPADTNENVGTEFVTEQSANENTVAQETTEPAAQAEVTESVSEAKEPVTKQSEATASEQVDELREPTEEQTNEVLPQEVVESSEQVQEVNATEQESNTLEQQETNPATQEQEVVQDAVQEEVQTSTQQAESFVESFGKRTTRKLFEQVQQLKSNFVAKATNIFVKFPNLVARVKSGEDILGSLKETPITEGEQEVWNSFQRFNDFMSPFVQKIFKKLPEDNAYAYQDWTQEFINEDGSIHPDVLTAINTGLYTWVTNNAKGSLFNDPATIVAIAQLKDDKGNSVSDSSREVVIPHALYKLLATKGVTIYTLRAEVGQAIVTAMGLKTTPDSAANAQTNLESSLGTAAVEALLSARTPAGRPIVKVNNVFADDVQEALKGTEFTSDIAKEIVLVSFADSNERTNLSKIWDKLVFANSRASTFIHDLFKVPVEHPEPSFTPPKDFKYGKTIKKGLSLIPQITLDILNRVNKQPWRLNTSTDDISQYLGDDAIREMLGYEFNLDRLIAPLRIIAEGQNDQIDRDLAAMREFAVLARENGDFYLTTEVWRNHRVGISNIINPQASKMHRNWIHSKAWETEIDISDNADLTEFLLSVGAGFDISAEKQSKEDAVKAVLDMLAKPEIEKAIQAIRDIRADATNEQTMEDIVAGVLAGKHGMHTFNTLVTYAEYLDAVKAGETKFTHALYREVDGKTNGISWLLSQFPTRNRTKLLKQFERVGLYSDGITETYADWSANENNMDSYQTLIKAWMGILGPNFHDESNRTLVALRALTGDFIDPDTGTVQKAGRDSAKPIVMTSGYGAQSDSRFANFIEEMVTTPFYNKLQKALDRGDQQAIDDLFKLLNQISGLTFKKRGQGELGNTLIVHPNGKTELLMEFELTADEVAQLDGNLKRELIKPLDQALNDEYGDMFDSRARFTTAVNIAGSLYSVIFNYEVNKVKEQKYAQAVADGKIADDAKSKRTYLNSIEPTLKELDAINLKLQNIYPAINTPLSKKDIKSRLPLVSGESTIQSMQQNSPYLVQVNLTTGVKKQAGRKREYSPFGVGVSAVSVHSLDAATMMLTQALHPGILNVHDAKLDGQQNSDESSDTINQKYFEVNSNYSLPDEFVGVLERVLQAVQENPEYASAIREALAPITVEDKKTKKKRNQTSPVAKQLNRILNSKEYSENTKGMSAAQKIAFIRKDVKQLANELNTIRKEAYAQLTSINQYTQGKGTNYTPKAFSRSPEAVVKSVVAQATNTPNSVDSLGSHGGNHNDGSFKEHLDVTPVNSIDVFNKLGNQGTVRDTAAHTAQLRNTMENIVNKALSLVHLTIKEAVGLTSYGQLSGTDMTLVNAIEGTNPNTAPKFGMLRISSQEVYVHELVHAITKHGVDTNVHARRELKRLWQEAKKAIDAPENKALYEANKEMFDRVFKPSTNNQGNVDYLHEFVAYGMSHAPMMAFLSTVKATSLKSGWWEGNNLSTKLFHFFNKLLDTLNGLLVNSSGTNLNDQLNNLVRRMATIDTANRGYVMHLIGKKFVNLDAKLNAYNPKVRDAVNAAIKASRKLGRVRKYVITPLAPVATLLNWDEVNPMVKQINVLTKQGVQFLQESELGFARELAALAYESMGTTSKNGALVDARRQAKAAIDREREVVRNATKQILMSSFDPTVALSEEDKTALTYTVVKSDLASLLTSSTTVGEVTNMVVNQSMRKTAIADVEAELFKLTSSHFERLQAQNLGYFMATGKSLLNLPRFNAYSISRGEKGGKPNPAVEALVDKLATLYALEYTNLAHLAAAKVIIDRELSRGTDENGIATLLATMHKIKQDSQENLFNDSKDLMIKGYMSETFDDSVAVKFSSNPEDEALISLGYVREMTVSEDAVLNPNGKKYIYVNRHGGMNDFLSGALSIQSKHHRGTLAELASGQGIYGLGLLNVVKGKTAEDTVAYRTGRMPVKKQGEVRAIPVYNASGDIVDFRYVMSDSMKDSMLRRETAFDEVVSVTAGSVVAKPQVRKSNYAVLEVLKATMDKYYATEPEDFVVISRTAPKKEHREMWRMLPYETREDIKSVFGEDKIVVRKDSLTIAFGHRKYSTVNIWDKLPIQRNYVEKAIYAVATKFFGAQAANKLKVAGDFWVELVKLAKDLIVIKSFVITLANTLSNMLLLMIQGINPIKYLYSMGLAYKAAQDYKKGTRTIKQLDIRLANQGISTAQRSLYEQQRAMLIGDLQTNAVKHMIDAGALQNIEEIDVDSENKLLTMLPGHEKVRKFVTTGLPNWMQVLGRNLTLMQNSDSYQFLRNAAQMSDFAAKLVMVEKLTKQKKNPMPMQEAIRQASDLFIDYDLPTGVFTQYLNDIGVLMFTKYLIRVQKHILMTARKKPIQTLLMLFGTSSFGTESSIFDSLIGVTDPFSRLTTPVELLGALDENMYEQMITGLF